MDLGFCKELLGEGPVQCIDAEDIFGGLASGFIPINENDDDPGAMAFDRIIAEANMIQGYND